MGILGKHDMNSKVTACIMLKDIINPFTANHDYSHFNLF